MSDSGPNCDERPSPAGEQVPVFSKHFPRKELTMTDGKPTDPNATDLGDTAKKSVEAGIADESAAYEQAIEADDDTDDTVAEGRWKSTDDGSGTSETD